LHSRRYIYTIKQLLLHSSKQYIIQTIVSANKLRYKARFNNSASKSTICQSSRSFTFSISSQGSTNSKDLPLIHEIKTSSHFVCSISNKTQRENSKTYNLL
jgi:hypothetical protein